MPPRTSYIAIEHRRSNVMTGTGSEFMWDGIAAIQCTKLQRVETLSMHRASPAISIPHLSSHQAKPENVSFE